MIRVLQSSWVTALVGCLLYLGTTLALIRPSQFAGVRAALAPAPQRQPVSIEASWKFKNPEFDQWLQEIKQEKEALDTREQQLKEFQARLESERQELNAATQTVYRLQSQFDQNVVRFKAQEMDNLKRQARVLAGMSPDGAAGLIRDMNADDAMRVLFTMKPDDASAVLDALSKMGKEEARQAASITEEMSRALPPAANPPATPNP